MSLQQTTRTASYTGGVGLEGEGEGEDGERETQSMEIDWKGRRGRAGGL